MLHVSGSPRLSFIKFQPPMYPLAAIECLPPNRHFWLEPKKARICQFRLVFLYCTHTSISQSPFLLFFVNNLPWPCRWKDSPMAAFSLNCWPILWVIYHNTIISRFSKPIDCVLCISHVQNLDLPHLLLRISSGFSVEINWACFECSSPARLFHLWGWLVPISRHIPNLKHIKIIWIKPLQLKILLKSARFAYNDRTPPVGKAGGGDRWPSNRSQFGYWTCKINLWVDSVELNR